MCLAAAGALIGAAGSLFQGMAQASAYKAEAKGLEYQAQAERSAAGYEAGRLDERGRRLTSQQVTAFSAEGVSIASGSPAQVILDSKTEVELDKGAIRFNAEAKARNLEYQAKVAKMNAKSAVIGGVFNAVAGAVSGLGGISGGTGGGYSGSTYRPPAATISVGSFGGNIPIGYGPGQMTYGGAR